MPEQPQSALTREWDSAEAAIKSAEILSRKVSIPAVYNLRLAGRSAVDALATPDATRQTELFSEAILYCRRARADAIDAQLMYLIAFESELDRVKLEGDTSIADAASFRAIIGDIGQRLGRSRYEVERRDSLYDELQGLLPKATDLYRSLRPQLTLQEQTFRTHRQWNVAISLAAGLVTAISASALFEGLIPSVVRFFGF